MGKHTELKLDLNKIDYLSFRLSGIELITAGFEETLARQPVKEIRFTVIRHMTKQAKLVLSVTMVNRSAKATTCC